MKNWIFRVSFVLLVLVLLDPVAIGTVNAQPPVSAKTEADGNAGFLDGYRQAAIERWEDDIAKLETLDASQTDADDAILMIGSSSIRRWANVAVDMAPYRIIRRGYGGAKYSDVAVFAERLIRPHDFRALVLFVGNDVAGKPEDHSPEEVIKLVDHIVGVSRTYQPDAPVLIIEVTPTIKRFAVWPKIRSLNSALRDFALQTPNVYFVATAGHFLDPQCQPRSDLFVEDDLHLNAKGYTEWSGLIRRRLDEVFRLLAQSKQTPVATTEH